MKEQNNLYIVTDSEKSDLIIQLIGQMCEKYNLKINATLNTEYSEYLKDQDQLEKDKGIILRLEDSRRITTSNYARLLVSKRFFANNLEYLKMNLLHEICHFITNDFPLVVKLRKKKRESLVIWDQMFKQSKNSDRINILHKYLSIPQEIFAESLANEMNPTHLQSMIDEVDFEKHFKYLPGNLYLYYQYLIYSRSTFPKNKFLRSSIGDEIKLKIQSQFIKKIDFFLFEEILDKLLSKSNETELIEIYHERVLDLEMSLR